MRGTLIALFLAACSPGGEQLSASWTLRYQAGAEETIQPGDWEGAAFDVFVEAEDGTRSSVVPSVEEGRFAIDADGPARYYLRRLDPDSERLDVWVSRGDDVDLVSVLLGRPDVSRPEEPTSLRLEGSGLAPWDGGPLQIVAPEVGAIFWTESVESVATDVSVEVPWEAPLLDAREGDQLLALQLVSRERSLAVEKILAAGPTTLQGGEANLVRGEFVEVPRRQFQATVALDEIPDHVGGLENVSLSIRALPRAGTHGWYDAAPLLGRLVLPIEAGTTEATLDYGSPFASRWEPFVILEASEPWSFDPAGRRWLYATLPVGATVTPSITPVRAVAINGEDALVPRSDLGERPRLTWAPPEIGEPARYLVRVLTADDQTVRAVLRTSDPELRFPPGLLERYRSYYLQVIAQLPRGLPGGAAGITTARIEP